MKSYYLHVLNGRPAHYDGRQVCYMRRGAKLIASLDELRAQQKASATWREKHGYSAPTEYGYCRVVLP